MNAVEPVGYRTSTLMAFMALDPAGVHRARGGWDGVRRLQRAALLDALRILSGVTRITKVNQGQPAIDTAWVASHDTSQPLTFVCCCEAWGLDPGAVRNALQGGALYRCLMEARQKAKHMAAGEAAGGE